MVFFKDKQSIVFSLLTSIIVLVLYLLFLKGNFVDAMNGILDECHGLSEVISAKDIDMFANLVLLTGILGSAMITVPYNCLTMVVRDRENRIDYDVLATPVKRSQIILSYFASASLASIILTGIILTIGMIVIGLSGDLHMSFADVLETYGVVALGSVSATAVFMILVLFFKTSSASGAFFGMLAAASGFVIGAYVPISQFSGGIQTVCNLFPASQITIILRNKLMGGVLESFNASIGGLDNGLFVDSLMDAFTFKAHLFNSDLGVGAMLVYVLGAIVVCVIVQVVLYSGTYKKK